MNTLHWMIYGANGYMGRLIAEEAIRRGHRPVLAGRSPHRLAPMAKKLGLDHVIVDLNDPAALSRTVRGFRLVFHAAGPFLKTSAPMLRACLEAGAHYLDLSAELPVLEQNFLASEEARRKGIAILSGAAFDVVATDCLARHVSDRLNGATRLELAVTAFGRVSSGTARTMLELLPRGAWVIRGGRLKPQPLGQGRERVRFRDGERAAIPAPLGGLLAAFRTTGIPNVTTFVTVPAAGVPLVRFLGPIASGLLSIGGLRKLIQMGAGLAMRGPGEEMRQTGRSHLWARASREDGAVTEAWLETAEAYQFTAAAALACVERILKGRHTGTLTPAGAFGADFVLEIPGTRRYDAPGPSTGETPAGDRVT